ncbi:NAD(P)-binding Rossmann-fold superfamily protein [Striga asiatica]|uniref:NAD(P)-binding Rossmann-fold superfamily protein n=1 Tax=Striga asiatica TaxID=4170 RepID=A0A5A7R9G3_STRAF|nr:NAD(P)-binding Rossmann-fold superfamily protein [Striga asiatica]
MAKRLEGKVALITGGASGIGEATAKLFARHGAKVTIADVQDDLGSAIAREFPSIITYVHCDVTLDSDVAAAVDGVVAAHGRLDIMFCNAGITVPMHLSSVLDADRAQFERVFAVNVYGAFHGAKHAARAMISAGRGSIVFTSSAVVATAVEAPIPYAVSKYAVVGLANQLCMELGKHGIRVNCVSPFLIATPMMATGMGAVDEGKAAEWVEAAANLKGATAEVDDIAEAVVYLGSDESKYVSGMNLVVDGGYSKVNPMLSMAIRGVGL